MNAATHDARVLIVGAGPAGSSLAIRLARRGQRVLILDRARFPRAKACGECLNPGAVAALDRLGVSAALAELEPAPLSGWRLITREGARAKGSFGPEARSGLAVPRRELDAMLLAAARAAGARVREGVHVRTLTQGPHGVTVHGTDEDGRPERWTTRILVGADGLRSVVARQADLVGRRPRLVKASATFRLEGHCDLTRSGTLFLGPGFTVGLAPVSSRSDRWNGTLVVDPSRWAGALAADPQGLFLERLSEAPIRWSSGPGIVEGPWTSGPFDWPCPNAARGSVIAVGDAAGYYDPLTGQGIYRALRSSELAEGRVLDALADPRGPERALAAYSRALAREFAPGRRVQHVIEACLSSDSLRPRVVGLLGRSSDALSALIRVTGDARRVRSLADPGLWLTLVRPQRAYSR